jgi:flavorubredoxin
MIDKLLIKQNTLDFSSPILLFEKGGHKIYWLGVNMPDAFRTNIYLIVDGEEAVIVDPGNKAFYPKLYKKIEELGYVDNIIGGIFCHQDPDVAGSLSDWVNNFREFKVMTSSRTNILFPHYGVSDYNFYPTGVRSDYKFEFKSGNSIKFIEAPFLHFPGAITTYDPISGFLFSGDIWAAIDYEFRFIVQDFVDHIAKLNLFHLDYMSSSVAARGYVQKLVDYDIDAILPQHGSIISSKDVNAAIKYLDNLYCGLDLIYPDL